MQVRLVAFVVTVALLVSCAPGASASPRVGFWKWTEPDVSLHTIGPQPVALGPTQAATIELFGPYRADQDWKVVMSDATLTCHAGGPHYSPTVAGNSFFDTLVPGTCFLSQDGGYLHAHWIFGSVSGDDHVGPMRGDGFFS